MTLSIMTFSIMTFSIMTLSIMTLSKMTLGIMALSKMTSTSLGWKGLTGTNRNKLEPLSINKQGCCFKRQTKTRLKGLSTRQTIKFIIKFNVILKNQKSIYLFSPQEKILPIWIQMKN
jgi:hypothetical protein